ncbi:MULTISPECIES: sigma-70 family RNA polymerase sigma factor [unclassified Paenibacillus]|uniref:RNA polymerase sigma factor n=1 Tax=Paenibacillus sp. RUD330 TaxID=2023772 RepID=UPI000955A816|nr:sigma-70 family RNA polymerase sigma factor [Paenibacillus sp. RUD330]SIQ13618.1 RNA polymerase sigma factor, sigma-70 family [Paenibacillus sp. RU4X]SIQ35426.1 RNA polymerase sigma factor, sigma-70 family [Paenibacillus sp. RU4T]
MHGKGGNDIQSDIEWLQSVRDGGPERFGEIIDEYGAYLYRTVYAVLRSPQDTEDVLQEALLAISRALPECRLEGFKTWITRIAVNRAIDYRRKRQRQEARSGSGEALDDSPEVMMRSGERNDSPPDQLIAMEERRRVQDKLEELPPEYKGIVRDYYFRRRSYQEISEESGLKPKSVESKLYRARSWMKRHWRREDFD